VYLQAKLEARYGRTTRDVRAELRDAGFSHDLIRANVRRLRSIVASLRWQPPVTASSADRGRDDDDDSGDAERRRAFVTQVLRSRRRSLVWDLWCRTGFFARLAAAHADYVVAIDADQGALERLFQQLRRQELPNVLPLCINLADPSPGLGWRGVERQPLDARGVPDLVLCLAYLPHLVIGSNVRLRDVLDWLASVSEELIIEFVTRDDPMVQQLLRNREDHYSDYQQDVFDVELSSRYHVLDRTVLANGARILFYGRRRVAA
ncbi:MAG: methyltransferase, partial [Acidobacteria bacterium]|nr:methyltransferase [Acidobacteriota bacterium]